MTVERLENGDYKTQSGMVIPVAEACELFHFMEHEYNKSEIINEITETALIDEDYPDSFDAHDVSNDLVEELTNEYEHILNNTFDYELIQNVVYRFKESILSSVEAEGKKNAIIERE